MNPKSKTFSDHPIFPLSVTGGAIARTVAELAAEIIRVSDEQVFENPLADEEDRVDFQVSCDGLNFWRFDLRLKEEHPSMSEHEVEVLHQRLAGAICGLRDYEPDEFRSALVATQTRAKTPFGLDPLGVANVRAQQNPIVLLVPELKDSKLAMQIASVAFHLQNEVGHNRNFYLPIDNLRSLLSKRKVVVSGTLDRLVDGGVIDRVVEKYHTSRAREYQFSGVEGKHFISREQEETICDD